MPATPAARRRPPCCRTRVTVSRVNRSSVLAVSFRSTDKLLAARITKAYANAYLNDQLNANFDATESASVWLQQRLADLRERSQQAALDVAKFKTENGLTSANGELMSEQQLADLNKQLIVAQADSASASARYNQFKSIVDLGPDSAVNNAAISSGQTDNTVIQDLRTRYISVNKREQEVTTNFGEDHPQAVALRAEKQDLTRQIYQELQQLTSSYRNEFEVARSAEASLRQNIEHLTGKNSEADRSIVQLSDLEQRATALKTLYESYLGKYEEASQQQSFPIAKARVISEAGVPVSPSSPKKTMTLGLAIVLGLMAGGALAAFQEFRERFFRVEGDVRTILGLKFLGYLPLIGKAPRERQALPARANPALDPAEAAADPARPSNASCVSSSKHRARSSPKPCAMRSLRATSCSRANPTALSASSRRCREKASRPRRPTSRRFLPPAASARCSSTPTFAIQA